ncbi:LysM peptidoglycan-binding domain-containing protein [Epibacterium sp. Ofav1-8]|uniref:LysM peptidoglycan-binding domain-containing protein n=1 Tax=Epibacterium sp. Ofav1-8 TaxID=2917735 RepID=UPI001EF5FB0C|nr:LysM peptidoglycan-binding domain-containing protein [Epibacterium sp. Ofav1-8]MCG7622441.1 LysM peptidoglycan-binding domain-containing protein [Epibacterium sp. Ofav1-8]
MTKTSGIGLGTGLAIGTVAAVVIVGGGIFLAQSGRLGEAAQTGVQRQLAALGLAQPADQAQPPAAKPEPEPEPEPEPTEAAPAEATAPEDVPDVAAAPEPAFELRAPVLEVARFETDGSGIVAGSAQVGVEVQVLLDGAVLDTQTVPEAGEFVSFVSIEVSDQPRILTLLSRFDGQQRMSEDRFILAPIQPQIAATDETPEADPAPGATAATEGDSDATDLVVADTSEAVAPQPEDEPASTSSTATTTEPAQESATDEDTSAAARVTEVTPPATGGEDRQSVAEAVPTSPAEETLTPDVAVAAPVPAQRETTVVATDTVSAPQAPDDDAVAQQDALTTAEAPSVQSAPVAAETPPAATAVTVADADAGVQDTQTAPPVAAESTLVEPDTPQTSTGTATPNIAADGNATPPEPQTTVAEAPATATEDPVETDPEPAPQPDVSVAVLRAGRDGVTLVRPASPVAPALLDKVALDTIGYTDAGEVQLAGRARPDALVRVYLDNSPVADIPTRADGRWSGSLTAIAPGIYTLRLDEIDPVEGNVLSRLETPFKREAPEVLQPALAAQSEAGGPAPAIAAVTVQKGDTLWAISQERYGSGFLYVRVFEANKDDIRDPDLIYPGQIFTLPQ